MRTFNSLVKFSYFLSANWVLIIIWVGNSIPFAALRISGAGLLLSVVRITSDPGCVISSSLPVTQTSSREPSLWRKGHAPHRCLCFGSRLSRTFKAVSMLAEIVELHCHCFLCSLPGCPPPSLPPSTHLTECILNKTRLYLGLGHIREIDSHVVGTFSVDRSNFPLVSREEHKIMPRTAFFCFLFLFCHLFFIVLNGPD